MKKHSTIPRRAVLKLSLALSGLLIFDGLLKFLGYSPSPETPTKTILNAPESYSLGSVAAIPELRCWLLRDEAGLYALSAVCTHLGCLVKHNESEFECPCHGSHFDLKGEVLLGPAAKPLHYVKLSRSSENLVVVDASVEVPADERLPVVHS